MVEANQKIPDRDEAELRPAAQGGEPSAASRVFDETPAGALDPAPGSRSYRCAWRCTKKIKRDEKALDDADDVIHGMYGPPQSCKLKTKMTVGRR